MLSCRELAQEKASDYIDNQLSPGQRLGFRLHLLLCGHCRRFMRQFKRIGQIVSRRPEEPVDEKTVQALADRLHHLHSHQHSERVKK